MSYKPDLFYIKRIITYDNKLVMNNDDFQDIIEKMKKDFKADEYQQGEDDLAIELASLIGDPIRIDNKPMMLKYVTSNGHHVELTYISGAHVFKCPIHTKYFGTFCIDKSAEENLYNYVKGDRKR
jgi:hypothetical protein